MANTSAIFKGSRTKLLTKDGIGLEAGQTIKVVDGAAANAVPVSDASGVLTVQALPAAAVPSLDASKVTTGTFDIARIPQAAMERRVTVADEAARYALTTASVQNGDTVYQTDTDVMYMVVDDTQLNGAGGYQVYKAVSDWGTITNKPDYATQAADASHDGYLTQADWGTFNGKMPNSVVGPALGGTGVANDAAATLTRSGNHALTLTTTAATNVTLPTTGTIATTAVITTGFDGNLSSAENTIQNAFDKIDNLTLNGQETNYITNQSAKNVITGWFAVGDLDVTRSSTASELPRENTTLTGIKIVADANTQSVADYVYYDFTLDDVDAAGRIMKIKWDQKVLATYAAGQFEVVITTQADRTTAIATPFTTAIPAQDGTFQTYFLAPSTTTLSLVIRATADMTTNDGIVISDVVVGPNVKVQGSANGATTPYTPTFNNMATATIDRFVYATSGDQVFIDGRATLGAGTAAAASITLPNAYTAKSTSVNSQVAGRWTSRKAATTGGLILFTKDLNTLTLADNAGSIIDGNSADIASQSIFFQAVIPVNELSSNVTLANRAVESYAADDGSADVFGPNGALVPNTSGTNQERTFTYPETLQATDLFVLEVTKPADQNVWYSAHGWLSANGGEQIDAYKQQNATEYGVAIRSSTTANTVTVRFGAYAAATGATYASAGKLWSALYSAGVRFRLRKVSGGASVGYPISSANIVGRTDGVAPAAGMVGNYVESLTVTAVSQTSGNYDDGNNGGIQLTSGTYDLQAVGSWTAATTTVVQYYSLGIGTVSGNSGTGVSQDTNSVVYQFGGSGAGITPSGDRNFVATTPLFRVTVPAGTTVTYYPKLRTGFSTSTMTARANLFARRVA